MKYCNKNIRLDRPQTHNWEEYETQELRINKNTFIDWWWGWWDEIRKLFLKKLQIKTSNK